MKTDSEFTGITTTADFPTISAGVAERDNGLVGRTRRHPFIWAGKPAVATLKRLSSLQSASHWLRLRLADHSFDLGLTDLPELHRLGPTFAGIEIGTLPEEIALAVIELWLADPLAALKAQGLTVDVTQWKSDATLPPSNLGWEISREGETFVKGVLVADEAALQSLAGWVQRRPVEAITSADSLPLTVELAVADLSLPLSTAQALEPGDVLFPAWPTAPLATSPVTLWCAGQPLALAQRNGRQFKILPMKPSSLPSQTATAGSVSLESLPVRLLFSVGQTELTIGQLRTLAEGYTFELPDSAPERLVTLSANGQTIGRGEIVDLGDKRGVRIVQWDLK